MSDDWGSYSWETQEAPQPEVPQQPKKKSRAGLIVATSIVGTFALVAGLSIFSGLAAMNGTGTANPPAEEKENVSSSFASNDLYAAPKDMETFVDAVDNATVRVECVGDSGELVWGTGWGINLADSEETTSDNAEPYEIVTNWHVIEGCISGGKVSIFLVSSPKVPHPATVFSFDNSFDTDSGWGDLAILTTATEVPSLETASEAPKKLQWALAIGNPADYADEALTNHMTLGVVSDYLIDRKWVVASAEVNPGNSGGPLLNSRGQVIAINTWSDVRDGIQGMFYSVAASQLCIKVLNCTAEDNLNW